MVVVVVVMVDVDDDSDVRDGVRMGDSIERGRRDRKARGAIKNICVSLFLLRAATTAIMEEKAGTATDGATITTTVVTPSPCNITLWFGLAEITNGAYLIYKYVPSIAVPLHCMCRQCRTLCYVLEITPA